MADNKVASMREYFQSKPSEDWKWEVVAVDDEGIRTELEFPDKATAYGFVMRIMNAPNLTFLSMAKRLK